MKKTKMTNRHQAQVRMNLLRRRSSLSPKSHQRQRASKSHLRRSPSKKMWSACLYSAMQHSLVVMSNANCSSSGTRKLSVNVYLHSMNSQKIQRTSKSGGSLIFQTSTLQWVHDIELVIEKVTNCWTAMVYVLIDSCWQTTDSRYDRISITHWASRSSSTMKMRTANRVDTRKY